MRKSTYFLVAILLMVVFATTDAHAHHNVKVGKSSPLPPKVGALVRTEARAAGVPVRWSHSQQLATLLKHESGYRFGAQNPTSTAYGLFQFLSSTWASAGCRYGV